MLGSEQPGRGVRIDDQGGEWVDANCSKSYSTRKNSETPKKQKAPQKTENPPIVMVLKLIEALAKLVK